MKAISSKPIKGITTKSRMTCSDNSGAKIVELIGVYGYKPRKRQYPKAGIADMIIIVVKKGRPEIRKKVLRAVIIRTKQTMKRANGVQIKFEDNAAVIVDKDGVPKGSEIKGCVPKEVGERYPKIVGMASTVV